MVNWTPYRKYFHPHHWLIANMGLVNGHSPVTINPPASSNQNIPQHGDGKATSGNLVHTPQSKHLPPPPPSSPAPPMIFSPVASLFSSTQGSQRGNGKCTETVFHFLVFWLFCQFRHFAYIVFDKTFRQPCFAAICSERGHVLYLNEQKLPYGVPHNGHIFPTCTSLRAQEGWGMWVWGQ